MRGPRHPAQGDDGISPEADGSDRPRSDPAPYHETLLQLWLSQVRAVHGLQERDHPRLFFEFLCQEQRPHDRAEDQLGRSAQRRPLLRLEGHTRLYRRADDDRRADRAAVARYLGDAQHYAITYGDGLTDADLAAELDYHVSHGKIGTVLGVNPPSRFGEFRMAGTDLVEFVEKPELHSAWINGGYFFFHRSFDRYLSPAEDCVLEREPLSKLARDSQLAVFQHRHFWACMDTQRDHEYLTGLWESGKAPWARTSDR